MGGTIPPINRIASWHANEHFTCTLLHPRYMDSVIDRRISALKKFGIMLFEVHQLLGATAGRSLKAQRQYSVWHTAPYAI
jgi:hypothetical protein